MTITNRFKPTTNITKPTTKQRTKRKLTMPNHANAAMPIPANSKPNDNTLTPVVRAFGELVPDFVKSLVAPMEIVENDIDALRFGADIWSVAAFIAERTENERAGKPEPAFPVLTSELARSIAAGVREWLTTFHANLTPEARENLGTLVEKADAVFKGKDEQLLDIMRQTITSDPRATASAVNFLVFLTITMWKAQ